MMEQLQNLNLRDLSFQELENVNGGSMAYDAGYAIGYAIGMISAGLAAPILAVMAWGSYVRNT